MQPWVLVPFDRLVLTETRDVRNLRGVGGTNLVGATGVMFDGRPPSRSRWTPHAGHRDAARGATSGPVSIVTADGVADASGTFTVTHDATLSLRLRPSSQGADRVRTDTDPGRDGCVSRGRRVVIENRVHGSWRQRGRAVSTPDGSFAERSPFDLSDGCGRA